jgi:hypothetical protein
MKGDHIKYRERDYKYQLVEDYAVDTCLVGFEVIQELFQLSKGGRLTIHAGYAWDGASGPTFDTADSMRGSLVHDVLYQMMREGFIPVTCKDLADWIFYQILIEDGMSESRAGIWHMAVSRYAESSCRPDSGNKEIKVAP